MDVARPPEPTPPWPHPGDGFFTVLADNIPHIVFTSSADDGRIEYFNRRWFDYTGLTAEETYGDFGYRRAVHPDDRQRLIDCGKRARAIGAETSTDVRYRRRDGIYRWHRVTAVPYRSPDGAIIRWLGTVIDVHDEIGDLTRNTPVLMYAMDPEGRVTYVNERWSQLTGRATDELLGDGMASIVEPVDLQRIRAEFRSRAPSDNEVVLRYRIRERMGRYRWIETRSVAERDRDGKIVRWAGAGLDIEEHVRATTTLEFLLESGAAVENQSDVVQLLEGVAQRVIEGLADTCVVDLKTGENQTRRIVVARPDMHGIESDYLAASMTIASDERHPVARAIYHGEATFVPIVDEAFLHTAVRDEERRARWRRQVHSVIVTPLRYGGSIFGAITIVRLLMQEPFRFSDLQVVEDVGRRIGLAIANAQLAESARRESEDRLEQFRRIADFTPQLMWTAGASGHVDWVNRQWYEFTGQSAGEAVDGRGGTTSPVHPDDRERAIAMWQEAVQSGHAYEAEVRMRRHDGVYRWCIARAVPERDASGAVVRWYGTTTDIDDSRRASRTIQLFAELGERLAESSALDETMDAILGVVVPEFADAAVITLVDEDRELIVRAVNARTQMQRTLLQSLIGHAHSASSSEIGSRQAFSTGRPYIENNLTEEDHRRALTPQGLAIAHRLGIHAIAVLPLSAASGVTHGTLVLMMTEEDRGFEDGDVPFYRELARRVTPAIANAELFERERNVAHSFQEAALPARLPRVPGYEFDAVYEAGSAEALVGGDWFDAFTLLDGRIVISIGDVAGAGLRAAVMMSNVRQAVRGVAQVHADPALMLEAADGVIRSQHPDTYVTAFVGVIDPMTNALVYQSAGHPRPLLVLPEGGIVELEGGGLPLGLRSEHEPLTCVYHVPNGSLLALYTDGLTEATHSLDEGYSKLFAALHDPKVRSAASPAKAIYEAMLPDGSKDDVAILTVRTGEATRGRMFPIPSARDEAAVRSMQRHLLKALRDGGMRDEAVRSAELIVAELVGNLMRYAPGPAVFTLAWHDGIPVLHLQDSGPGYEFAAKLPADPLAESGRGLFLIGMLARNFVVSPRLGGGSHSRVVFKM